MSVRNTVKSIQDVMRQDTGVDGDAQRISQLCWMFFLKIIDDQDQELELLNADYRSPIPAPMQWRTWATRRIKRSEIRLGDKSTAGEVQSLGSDVSNYKKRYTDL